MFRVTLSMVRRLLFNSLDSSFVRLSNLEIQTLLSLISQLGITVSIRLVRLKSADFPRASVSKLSLELLGAMMMLSGKYVVALISQRESR